MCYIYLSVVKDCIGLGFFLLIVINRLIYNKKDTYKLHKLLEMCSQSLFL